MGQTPRSRSQGKNYWFPLKGFITRNTHVKYQCSSTHCSRVISNVKVFKKWVKLQGQGHRVKNNGTQEKNTHVKYQSSSSHCSKVISKVKVSRMRTELQNDRQDKNNMPPDLRSRGHKKNYHSLGAWNAISLFFPTAYIKGFVFHWSQAVGRKIKELGLAVTYLRREATHRYLKQLMALPFLPAQDIPAAFQQLRDSANTDSLQSLMV